MIQTILQKNDPSVRLGAPFGGFGLRSTNWVLTAASLAGSALSSIFGGAKARRAAKKAAQERQYRANAEKAWYDKAYNTDYLDTKAGQNLMRRAQDVQNEYIRKADGAAAVGGASASSVAQAKEAANRTMGNTIANIAASDTARKQQVEDAHHNNLMQQSQEREQAANQQAANTAQASQNMSNALMTASGSLESGLNTQGSSKLGGRVSVNGNTNSTNLGELGAIKTENAADAVKGLDPTIKLRSATGV